MLRSLGRVAAIAAFAIFAASAPAASEPQARFDGAFFSGAGDVEYLQLIDTARRMFAPDPEFQNLAMLYMPSWNGLVEGPTWDAWWIQNSYGTTYAALPFLQEPFLTFLQNSQDLWFDQMGDGKTERPFNNFKWVPPDGALCDAARPGWFVAKQGDGRVDIHDWGMEFTAAGLLMQSELLLIRRDPEAIARYLPKLERCANFIETRRDPANNLFLAGPAGNLLAPSFAGWKKPDGTYGMAYLAGLSITYIAALDRLIELEELAGRTDAARGYAQRRDSARAGLSALVTVEGYFIRSLDPDGTRHGVFGAAKHGYFEASPNHDAICFRVVDDTLAARIFAKLSSIPELRPHGFVLPNYPSYDDMYEKPEGLWGFGTWVNGGHWSTCEARMMMAYYRVGQFDDARKSMKALLGFARRFRMDNPLTKCGSDVYQPNQPVNLTYDAFGPAAAMVRGLFEFVYRAEGVTLIPHIPPRISELTQKFPVRFGSKQLFISTVGTGRITGVWVNGRRWKQFSRTSVFLDHASTPEVARVVIAFGGARPPAARTRVSKRETASKGMAAAEINSLSTGLRARVDRMQAFSSRLARAGLENTYEMAHSNLIVMTANALAERRRRQALGQIPLLAGPSQSAGDRLYEDTIVKLCDGLESVLRSAGDAGRDRQRAIEVFNAK